MIYKEKPEMVSTVRELGGWRTTITMDVRELTSKELAAYNDGQPEEEPVATAWTGEEIAALHHQDRCPDMKQVRQLIVRHIDAQTDAKILQGFVWQGHPVWLSAENQFNFKAAFDLAMQTQGATLPVTFKLGERDGQPVYYTFETMDDFRDFYVGAMGYIQRCLQEGWKEKDELIIDN